MAKTTTPSGGVLFSEVQGFPRWFFYLMISPLFLTIILMLSLGLSGVSDRDEMWTALAIVVPLQLVMLVLLYWTRFEKIVTTEGLFYRWRPFENRFHWIPKDSLVNLTVRKGPVMKYGATWIKGFGRVHTAGDGEGLQVQTKEGKQFFFGTADLLYFQRAMEGLLSHHHKMQRSER